MVYNLFFCLLFYSVFTTHLWGRCCGTLKRWKQKVKEFELFIMAELIFLYWISYLFIKTYFSYLGKIFQCVTHHVGTMKLEWFLPDLEGKLRIIWLKLWLWCFMQYSCWGPWERETAGSWAGSLLSSFRFICGWAVSDLGMAGLYSSVPGCLAVGIHLFKNK